MLLRRRVTPCRTQRPLRTSGQAKLPATVSLMVEITGLEKRDVMEGVEGAFGGNVTVGAV